MELMLSVLIGLGLSAACGFRVFVPLLITSLAAASGHITLGSNFSWLVTNTAIITFSVATFLEILAYFIPVVDNILDHIAAPAAVIAGIVISASLGYQLDPYMKWTLAVIAGGGSAAMVHTATSLTRLASTTTTFGTGNFVVAILELVGAVVTSIMAIFMPVLVIALFAFLIYFLIKNYNKRALKLKT